MAQIFIFPPKLIGFPGTTALRSRKLLFAAGSNVTLTPAQTGDAITLTIAATGGSAATQITETSGPTTLTVGAIADGQVLTRVGSTIVGAWALAIALTFDANTFETGPAPVEYSAGTSWA